MPAPLTAQGFPYILFGTAYVQLIDWKDEQINPKVLLSHGQSDNEAYKGRSTQLKMFSNKELYRVPFTKKDLDDARIIETLNLSMSK